MNINEMVNQAKAGDQEALIRLIMLQQHEYYRLAFVYLKNKEDALDALQDMIVILHENIGRLRNPHLFYSWSKTILVNTCKKILKRKNRYVLTDERDIEDTRRTESSDVFLTNESKQDIELGLEALNPDQKEAIRLRYFLDMEYSAIAEITQTPLGTVKSRIFNGLAKLKSVLGGDYR